MGKISRSCFIIATSRWFILPCPRETLHIQQQTSPSWNRPDRRDCSVAARMSSSRPPRPHRAPSSLPAPSARSPHFQTAPIAKTQAARQTNGSSKPKDPKSKRITMGNTMPRVTKPCQGRARSPRRRWSHRGQQKRPRRPSRCTPTSPRRRSGRPRGAASCPRRRSGAGRGRTRRSRRRPRWWRPHGRQPRRRRARRRGARGPRGRRRGGRRGGRQTGRAPGTARWGRRGRGWRRLTSGRRQRAPRPGSGRGGCSDRTWRRRRASAGTGRARRSPSVVGWEWGGGGVGDKKKWGRARGVFVSQSWLLLFYLFFQKK